MRKLVVVAAVILFPPLQTFAMERQVTLVVDKMYCAACPLFVERAISDVAGVESVNVSYETRKAVVVFDDNQTTVEEITEATTAWGYPSRVANGEAK